MLNNFIKTLLFKLILASTLLVCASQTQTTILPSEATSSTNQIIVDLGYAKYQGHVNPSTGNTEFLGIRFARAPVGNLRWDAPQPPLPQLTGGPRDVIVADTLPDRCIGTSSFGLGDFSPFVEGAGGDFSTREGSGGRVGRVVERSVIDPPGMSEDCLFLK